jgi:hypothetical protein
MGGASHFAAAIVLPLALAGCGRGWDRGTPATSRRDRPRPGAGSAASCAAASAARVMGGASHFAAAIVLPLALAGCLVGPDYARPTVETPPAFKDDPPPSAKGCLKKSMAQEISSPRGRGEDFIDLVVPPAGRGDFLRHTFFQTALRRGGRVMGGASHFAAAIVLRPCRR